MATEVARAINRSLAAKDAPIVGPHQGIAYVLPNDLCFAEVINEPEVDDRSKTALEIVENVH